MKLVQPDNMAASNYLEKACTVHAVAIRVTDQPDNQEGEPIDAVKIEAAVLEASDKDGRVIPGQHKKLFSMMLFYPDESSRDQGAFSNKRLVRAADALGILPEAKAGEELEIDWATGRAKQFVCTMKQRKDSEYLELAGMKIYRVNDPEVASVPKNEDAVAQAAGKKPAPVEKPVGVNVGGIDL